MYYITKMRNVDKFLLFSRFQDIIILAVHAGAVWVCGVCAYVHASVSVCVRERKREMALTSLHTPGISMVTIVCVCARARRTKALCRLQDSKSSHHQC